MPDLVDDVTIANMALAAFAGGAITGFDENTDLADTCRLIVPRMIDRCLIAQAWRMNHATRELQRIAFDPVTDPQPPNGWRYGYAFPADALRGPHRVSRHRDMRAGAFREWSREGRRIYTDAERIFATFTLRLAPHQWGPTFLDFCVTAVAAELVVPVTHDADLAAQMKALAWGTPREGGRGGLAGKVLDEDVSTDTGFDPSGDHDPLTAAFHGGGPSPGAF